MALASSKHVRLLLGGVVCVAAATLCLVLFGPRLGKDRTQLIAQLQSPRPEERALAIKKLAAQNRGEDLVFFTAATKDLSAIVRGEAANALGKSADPRVVDLLGELLADPDEDVESKAAMALAHFKNDKARAYLTLQYGRQGRSTRMAIVQALETANVKDAMATAVAAEAKATWGRNLTALSEAGALAEQAAAAEELGRSGRPDAVQKLEQLAKQGQVMLAAAAVRGLGHAQDPAVAERIALLLGESHPELREASFEALRELGNPAVAKPLTAVALEKSAASEAATRTLVSFPRSEETDAALCQVVLDGGEEAQATAGLAMAARGGCPLDELLKRLPSEKHTGRLYEGRTKLLAEAALHAVAGLGPTAKAAVPQVLPLLADPDPQVRALAFLALAGVGDPSTAEATAKAFAEEQKQVALARADWVTAPLPKTYGPGFEPEVRELSRSPAAVSAGKRSADLLEKVAALDNQRAAAAGKILRQERVPHELVDDLTAEQLAPYAAGLQAMGAVHAEGARELLDAARDDDAVQVRVAAYRGLVGLGDSALKDAENGLFDASMEVRTTVAEALGKAGKGGQAALLDALPKLAGEKLDVLRALDGTLLPASAAPVIAPLLRAGGAESSLAAHLLGQLKASAAVPDLLKIVEDPTAAAQREAIWALGQIADPKAATVVGHELLSESAELRAAAAEALAQLGGADQLAALRALEGDYDVRVRTAAKAALAKLSPGASGSAK